MKKSKTSSSPNWARNLRSLMEEHGYNPRSLSLKAGLNATAVRDMLEGRSRFPRYDTARALAHALRTTPALLMGDEKLASSAALKGAAFGQDLDLLTEIVTRLREVTDKLDRKLAPRDFAAMITTIYRRFKDSGDHKKKVSAIRPQIRDLLDYQLLRRKRGR
jgi:transcriptional regulator with XRE-family HTH domain